MNHLHLLVSNYFQFSSLLRSNILQQFNILTSIESGYGIKLWYGGFTNRFITRQRPTPMNAYGRYLVFCHDQDIINAVTWHNYQIKCQKRYHNTIVVILLYKRNESPAKPTVKQWIDTFLCNCITEKLQRQ